ncbi:MAG TPA: hypothetical protein VFR81_24505, partial [Longimicrobium sp.]|nr:hypothetical protein [Longimicrobium sp.]
MSPSRRRESTGDAIVELPDSGVLVPRIDDLVEYDPDAPQEIAFAEDLGETADTLSVDESLLAAQRRLEEGFGGPEAFAASAAEEVSDYQGGTERVVGTAVGFRFVNGTLTSEMVVKILVTEISKGAEASALSAVPSDIGVPVVVEEVGEVVPQMYNRRYARPVRCGVSIGHPRVTAGTIGCLVQLNNGRLCLLSNNHVIADSNRARIGDPILQPGPADTGVAPGDRIAALENFVPIAFPGPNLVDAAVAWTSRQNVDRRHVTFDMSTTPVQPRLGMTVMKNGRTTQATLGTITDLSVNVSVGYAGGVAQFRNQIGIRGVGGVFSRGGDSGSVIVTANTKQPVALLFAGRRDNSVTFANPIATV